MKLVEPEASILLHRLLDAVLENRAAQEQMNGAEACVEAGIYVEGAEEVAARNLRSMAALDVALKEAKDWVALAQTNRSHPEKETP